MDIAENFLIMNNNNINYKYISIWIGTHPTRVPYELDT